MLSAAIVLFCSAASAVTYSFVTLIDFATDQSGEFSQTVTFFLTTQGSGARFSPSDTLNFVYTDGTIATFGLQKGTADICIPQIFGSEKCIWSSTVPFTNAGRPTAVRNRPGMMTIGTPVNRDEHAVVMNSGWFDYSPLPQPIPIAFPNAPPVGWLWGHGVVTSGPLTMTDINGTPLTPGATASATDPVTGRQVTATVSSDGQSVIITTGGGGIAIGKQPPVQEEGVGRFAFRDTPASTFSTNPTSFSFSATANHSQVKSMTITNQDSLETAVTTKVGVMSGAGTGSFSVATGTCGASLTPGASCAVNIRYDAGCGAPGSNAATLFVGSASVSLTGSYSSGMCY